MPVLPSHYLDTVVAFGLPDKDGRFIPLASGFFLGKQDVSLSKGDDLKYHGYLVTNKHVLGNQEFIAIRLNRLENAEIMHYIVPRRDNAGIERWHFHPDEDVDVAIIDMHSAIFDRDSITFNFFRDDLTYLMREDYINLGIAEGDLVYALGFPMGLAGESRNYTIVRSGSIARIADYLQGASKTFMIDCFVFPGNSGGPVVLRPSIAGIGRKPVSRAHLLGVVSAYLPYTDIAISAQTGIERVRFQENSGLALVYPVQFIEETIASYLKEKPPIR